MNKKLKSPFKLVADILEIKEELLNEDSTMGETFNWDSLSHFDIICAMESEYSVKIPNSDFEKYMTMKSIIELYKSLT